MIKMYTFRNAKRFANDDEGMGFENYRYSQRDYQ